MNVSELKTSVDFVELTKVTLKFLDTLSCKETKIAKNEKTSKRVASTAAKVLRKGKATPKQAKSLAGSVLTQAPDRKKRKK